MVPEDVSMPNQIINRMAAKQEFEKSALPARR
jgi:hypothetical protein